MVKSNPIIGFCPVSSIRWIKLYSHITIIRVHYNLHIKKLSIRYILQVFKYMRKTSKIAPLISIPTIIFQGKLDKGISPEAVEKFYEKLGAKDKELHMIEEGYHALITDPSFQDKWDILLEWIKTR